jgi:hypothetical protein
MHYNSYKVVIRINRKHIKLYQISYNNLITYSYNKHNKLLEAVQKELHQLYLIIRVLHLQMI